MPSQHKSSKHLHVRVPGETSFIYVLEPWQGAYRSAHEWITTRWQNAEIQECKGCGNPSRTKRWN